VSGPGGRPFLHGRGGLVSFGRTTAAASTAHRLASHSTGGHGELGTEVSVLDGQTDEGPPRAWFSLLGGRGHDDPPAEHPAHSAKSAREIRAGREVEGGRQERVSWEPRRTIIPWTRTGGAAMELSASSGGSRLRTRDSQSRSGLPNENALLRYPSRQTILKMPRT